jgi:hypothetical protein
MDERIIRVVKEYFLIPRVEPKPTRGILSGSLKLLLKDPHVGN